MSVRVVKHVSVGSSRLYTRCYSAAPPELYDVVISGGGMVGAAMAAALGSEPSLANRKILLIEGRKQKTDKSEKWCNRTSAISPSSYSLLDRVKAAEHIEEQRLQPVKRMQVWDGCSEACISFSGSSDVPTLAYIIENDVIQLSLNKVLTTCYSHVNTRTGVKIAHYTLPKSHQQHVELTLKDGTTIATKLLIGADGFNSGVRSAMNVNNLSWNYNQTALVATLFHYEKSENNVAWQRFLPNGPLALLPLSGDVSNLIWSTTPEQAAQLMALSDGEFVEALNSALFSDVYVGSWAHRVSGEFESTLRGVLGVSSGRQLPPSISSIDAGSRATYPLGFAHAAHYTNTRVALIGDAAHRLHPLAGVGANLGFADVTCLTQKLTQAAAEGKDLGSSSHLLAYESARQRENVMISGGCDGLYRLFSTHIPPVVAVRSLALQLTNACTPLKNMFASLVR